MFEVDDVGQGRFGEPQDGERTARGGVASTLERDHLDGDVRQPGDLQQVLQLAAHRLRTTLRSAQRGLVDHHPHLGRLRPVQQPGAAQAQADAAFHFLLVSQRVAQGDDGAGVVLGLQNPGNELELIATDEGGRRLQPDIGLEPAGDQVGIGVPPSASARLADQAQEDRPPGVVEYPVAGQQVGGVARLQRRPPGLQSADLGGGAADDVAGLLLGDAQALPKLTQLVAQDHAQDGRRVRVGGHEVGGRRLTADGGKHRALR